MTVQRLAPLLNVESVARSIEFYRGYLEFQVVDEWESQGRIRWAFLQCQDARLMLNELSNGNSENRREHGSYTDVVLYLYVEDAQALRAALHAGGVEVGELEDTDYGMREFYARDPDGYELGFGSPVPQSHPQQ